MKTPALSSPYFVGCGEVIHIVHFQQNQSGNERTCVVGKGGNGRRKPSKPIGSFHISVGSFVRSFIQGYQVPGPEGRTVSTKKNKHTASALILRSN